MDDLKEEDLIEAKIPRKPGRPRKSVVKLPKPRNGIVLSPSDAKHYIEFLYDKPLIFKKLWQFFKLLACDKLHLSFLKDSIIIYCSDHHKKSHIRVKINCNEVNHYYCEKDLDIGLLCKNPELIMGTIDKSYNSILFLSTHDNIQRNINIVLKNDIHVEETHKIELIGEYDKSTDDAKFTDEDYKIKFKLTGKYFKKMISDIKTFSDILNIRQDDRDDNLMIEYIKHDKKIKSLHIMKNSTAIDLRSTLTKDETFRTSVKIDYIKPLSSALLADNIEIYADEVKPLKFIIDLDDKCIQIVILTDIIDQRTEIC